MNREGSHTLGGMLLLHGRRRASSGVEREEIVGRLLSCGSRARHKSSGREGGWRWRRRRGEETNIHSSIVRTLEELHFGTRAGEPRDLSLLRPACQSAKPAALQQKAEKDGAWRILLCLLASTDTPGGMCSEFGCRSAPLTLL